MPKCITDEVILPSFKCTHTHTQTLTYEPNKFEDLHTNTLFRQQAEAFKHLVELFHFLNDSQLTFPTYN